MKVAPKQALHAALSNRLFRRSRERISRGSLKLSLTLSSLCGADRARLARPSALLVVNLDDLGLWVHCGDASEPSLLSDGYSEAFARLLSGARAAGFRWINFR
jgi:hypothetical protein